MANDNKKSMWSIIHCLSFLCNIFGQKINLTKSKIILNKNRTPSIREVLSHLLNIKVDDTFGIYPGFPILNHKPKATNFQHIIDNMHGKLATWKMNMMSLANRTKLAKSTLLTIPKYSMQIFLLPRKILNPINKIQRDSIWGSTSNRKKIHYAS